MNPRQHLARLMAALMVIGALLGAAAPAAARTPVAPSGAAQATDATLAAPLASYGEPFHWLPPLGVESGDATKFDASLLNDLVVTICRVEGPACTPVKTLTSTSSLSERLRIGQTSGKDSYYLANWDVSKLKLEPFTFRLSVTVARLQIGSIDVGPSTYKSFGRTWPIKFRVEKNPIIRVRILHEAGLSASQVANRIRLEFGICGDDLAQLLRNDVDPFDQDDVDQAVAGVCQDAEIPATTKVADPATQKALTAFDPETGRMTFSGSSSILTNLKAGDVLVGEPAAAAPNGYLRHVTSITRNKKTGITVVETTQARLDEAIRNGTMDAEGMLDAGDVQSVTTTPGVTLTSRAMPQRGGSLAAGVEALDLGNNYEFHENIDITIDGSASSGAVSGDGTIHITGSMDFNAGYNVGLGIEDCLDSPPFFTCVDRFEAHFGSRMNSNLKVTGDFNGHLEKEVVLSTHYFKPIIFFIGPIPVVLLPIVKASAGISGDAHLDFSFELDATSAIDMGAKWTDPDDGGVGWENVSAWPPVITNLQPHADALATMDVRAYAEADAKILLYGVAGPGIAGHLGLWGHVQFPGTPLWKIYGIAQGEINFAVDLGGLLTLAEYHAPLPEFSIKLAQAENEPPTCSGRTDPIPVAPGVATYLGPQSATDSFSGGYFACADPEGGELDPPIGKENGATINLSAAKWDSGEHDVVITVTDEDGKTSDPFTLHIKVIDTPPILSTTSVGGSIPVGVQYFATASAWDVEGGEQHGGSYLPCTAFTWEVTGGVATKAASNRTCTISVVFTQTGAQTIKVTGTEPGGKSSTETINVFVGSAPANAAPVIDMDHFDVMAATGPKVGCYPGINDCHEACASGFFCMVPQDSILYNGTVGSFKPPLTLSVDAVDPDGSPLTVQWFCQVGTYQYAIKDNGDGTFECNPYTSSISTPILIWATVSDGTTTVKTEVRRLLMLDRLV
ncbi:MAG TPA: hypothetical protein VJ850_07205 [Candidatus Limnocylindrales bacterium]|nr:hypothetical protein [Candidatus Limnocylindrales bacterium]